MATGVYCYPNDEAAEVALSVTREWLEKHSDKVLIINFVQSVLVFIGGHLLCCNIFVPD